MQASPELPGFGSPFRSGRESPAYQQSRLASLLAFSTALAGAYARRVHHLQRSGRLVWQGKLWQEQEAGRQARDAAELRRITKELEGWIRQLEEAKAYHLRTIDEQRAWIAQLEEAKRYHEERSVKFESALHRLREGVREAVGRSGISLRHLRFAVEALLDEPVAPSPADAPKQDEDPRV